MATFDNEKPTWCHVQGHNFAVHGGIAPKLSKHLSVILAMPCAKFHTDGWSSSGENHDRTKNSKLSISPTVFRDLTLLVWWQEWHTAC